MSSIASFALLQTNSSPPFGVIVQSNGLWKQPFKSIPRSCLEQKTASVQTDGDDKLFLYPHGNMLMVTQTDKTQTLGDGSQQTMLNELLDEMEASNLWPVLN